ncbi:MAG: hypothetical protein AAGG68_05740 [Bacteroidota bacterium]
MGDIINTIFFEDFLLDHDIYDANERWWDCGIQFLLMPYQIEYQPYINAKFRNGKKFYNGNPMYNALVSNQKRAFKIIQENPKETDRLVITAWVDSFENDDDEQIEELTISMILSNKTNKIAQDWIEKWLVELVDEKVINELIERDINTLQEQIYQEE